MKEIKIGNLTFYSRLPRLMETLTITFNGTENPNLKNQKKIGKFFETHTQ